MAPVKFRSRDGEELAVGDMVWSIAYGVERGCVTGFDFEDGELDVVEIAIERPSGTRSIGASVLDVFLTELDAWNEYVRKQISDYRDAKANLIQRRGMIEELISAKGLTVEFKP